MTIEGIIKLVIAIPTSCVFCVWSLLCNAVFGVLFSFTIISLRMSELVTLLYVAFSALCNLRMVPWVSLRSMVSSFPGHCHLLLLKYL